MKLKSEYEKNGFLRIPGVLNDEELLEIRKTTLNCAQT